MTLWLGYVLIVVIAYLIGAIPVGAIVVRMYHIDITSKGSGKTGATSVLRTVGLGPALLVALGDLFKGVRAVVAARLIMDAFGASSSSLAVGSLTLAALPLAEWLAAVAAVAGHVWSIW